MFFPGSCSITPSRQVCGIFLILDWEIEVQRGKGVCPRTRCELLLETECFLKIFIYLAALGLSCSMRGLCWTAWTSLDLWLAGLVALWHVIS